MGSEGQAQQEPVMPFKTVWLTASNLGGRLRLALDFDHGREKELLNENIDPTEGVLSHGWNLTYLAAEKDAELDTLRARLALAEAVCEAAASVAAEERVAEELLAYNMGVQLVLRLAAWHAATKEGT